MSFTVLALLASVCRSIPPPPPPTTSPRPSPGPDVGSITHVQNPQSSVNGSMAFDGDRLHGGDRVSTNPGGWVKFRVDPKLEECSLRSGAVRVSPRSGVAIRYDRGTSYCRTNATTSKVLTLTSTNVEISFTEPIYGVTVTTGRTDVKVLSGFVEVRNLATGGQPLLVGPMQMTTVLPGVAPATVVAFDPTTVPSEEGQMIEDLVRSAPLADYSFPQIGTSPTLATMSQSKSFPVGLDARALRGADAAFADSFLRFLAEQWQVRLAEQSLDLDTGLKLMQSGHLDLLISPQDTSQAAAGLFFQDPQGVSVSFLTPADDPGFLNALSAFLATTLNSGEYAALYVQTFKTQPSYVPFGSLLGLEGAGFPGG